MQTSLFDNASELNILPKDGQANYLPAVFSAEQCSALFDALKASLTWETEEFVMFGQKITMRRQVAWVGDSGCSYTYSGMQKHPQPWTEELLLIKRRMEQLAQWEFNSCLLNLYHDGSDGMGWHSDNEDELDSHAPIASLSLGAERKFAFRHKTDKTTHSLLLGNGSVLLMRAPTQQFWNHSLLKTKTVVGPRINLTFRKIITGRM